MGGQGVQNHAVASFGELWACFGKPGVSQNVLEPAGNPPKHREVVLLPFLLSPLFSLLLFSFLSFLFSLSLPLPRPLSFFLPRFPNSPFLSLPQKNYCQLGIIALDVLDH